MQAELQAEDCKFSNLCSSDWWNTATATDLRAELKAGADVMARGKSDETPLHWAAMSGNPAHIQALLYAGADISAQDEYDQTPWKLAQENKNLKDTKVLEMLHKATVVVADPNKISLKGICETPGMGTLQVIVAKGKIVFTKDQKSQESDFLIDPKTGFLTRKKTPGDQIDLETGWMLEDGNIKGKCTLVNSREFPIEAGSWGGKVRAGPGMKYKQIGLLREGEVVKIIEDTGIIMSGYPWFKILYRNGKMGYKYGGILCAYDEEIDGVYSTCQIDNRNTK
jgi:hypothetical protein